MKKIAIISDTHNFIDKQILKKFNNCDEIWHAGDFGFSSQIQYLIENYTVRGVYGNIDGAKIRSLYPKVNRFMCEEVKVLMTHIGGYPKKYQPEIEKEIQDYKPNLYICGHSHILKIMYDKIHKLIHVNPGAAGKEGFHKIRTLVLLEINNKTIQNVKVVELGSRTNLA